MTDKHVAPSSDIRAEACAWIVQLETGDMTRADIEALREWMQRSPEHVAEIRRLARLSAQTNVLAEMAGPIRAAAAHYRDVVRPAPNRWRLALPWVGAVAVVMAVLVMTTTRPLVPHYPVLLTTAMGEYREEQMPDGSTLALNTDSQLEVMYSSKQRRVRLLRGEALFTVAKDPSRPFVVYAGDRMIEAVGTAFLVKIDDQSFEVAVTEGRVRLADLQVPANEPAPEDARNNPDSPVASEQPRRSPELATEGSIDAVAQTPVAKPIFLKAGQQLVVSTRAEVVAPTPPVVENITPREIQRKLAWQEGLLDFSDTPLNEVIREVSRHTALEIEIADPELRQLKFGGIFRTGDTAVLFKALETAYGIDVEQLGNTVRLTRPPQG